MNGTSSLMTSWLSRRRARTPLQWAGGPGRRARARQVGDVIVLNKDPIADITVLQGGEHLSWVIKDGRVVDLAPRDEMLTFREAAE